jgi:Domain of unknown function (DUF4169)
MGEIVNLRQARKRRRRADKESAADVSRREHGTPKSERTKAMLLRALAEKQLEAHRREDGEPGGDD